MLRILIVTAYAPPHAGGIEFVAWEQATRFAALGHQVTWVSSEVPTQRHGTPPVPRGVELIRWPALNPLEQFGIPYPLFLPGLSRKLGTLVRNADVVHTHGMLYRGTTAALNWAFANDCASVLTCHVIDRARAADPTRGISPARAKAALLGAVETTAHRVIGVRNLRRAGAVVVLTDAVGRFVANAIGDTKRVHKITNGVDLERYHPISSEAKKILRKNLGLPADKPIVGFIGRVVPRKGAHLVVNGTPEYAHALVVGRGELRNVRIPNGGLTRWNALPRDQIRDVLQACDTLVLPSVGEGFPLIVQEAMACGLPVVVGDDPAYADAVEAGALLGTPPTTLGVRDALTSLLSDHSLAERLSANARDFAQHHYRWELNISSHLALYEKLTRGRCEHSVAS